MLPRRTLAGLAGRGRRPRVVAALASLLLLAAVAPAAAQQGSAALSLVKMDAPDPVTAGDPLTYTITVSNEGPSDADTVTLVDTLPAGTVFASLSPPAGWSCTTPPVGSGGSVSCSLATLPPGSAVFTLVVTVDPSLAAGTVITNTATVSSTTPDPDPGNESGSVDTTVAAQPPGVTLTKADSPDPVVAGQDLTYSVAADNPTGSPLDTATLSDPLPAGTTFVSLAAPVGWSCSTPAVGAGGTVSCTATPFAPGVAMFTLVVRVAPNVANGTSLANTATLAVTDFGRDRTFTGTATTAVQSPPLLSASKTVAGTFLPGGAITYTLVVTNNGGAPQGDNPGPELTDVLPVQLHLVSANATSGTAVATLATNTVTWDGALAGGATVTLTIQATIDPVVSPGTSVSNQAILHYDGDVDGSNEASAPSDDPAPPGAADPTTFVVGQQSVVEIPTLDGRALVALATLLAALAALAVRRG
ncbi:MAG TPA: DUF11 domain-containing protein [Thermoanaerobaculia bacterium]|nr:DUF11 domain-containing protein [Thermoanaerobaculia bacterium]